MKLQPYLQALRDCPDVLVETGKYKGRHPLTTELGVYDNWQVLFNANVAEVVTDLLASGRYKPIKRGGSAHWLNFSQGTVELQIHDRFSEDNLLFAGLDEKGAHYQVQMEKFNRYLMLHPYQEKRIPNTSDERALVLVINDISQYFKQQNIPFCFPESMGWGHLDDLSRIVYFPDSLDDEVQARVKQLRGKQC